MYLYYVFRVNLKLSITKSPNIIDKDVQQQTGPIKLLNNLSVKQVIFRWKDFSG